MTFKVESELDVTLVNAKNLKAADIGGMSSSHLIHSFIHYSPIKSFTPLYHYNPFLLLLFLSFLSSSSPLLFSLLFSFLFISCH